MLLPRILVTDVSGATYEVEALESRRQGEGDVDDDVAALGAAISDGLVFEEASADDGGGEIEGAVGGLSVDDLERPKMKAWLPNSEGESAFVEAGGDVGAPRGLSANHPVVERLKRCAVFEKARPPLEDNFETFLKRMPTDTEMETCVIQRSALDQNEDEFGDDDRIKDDANQSDEERTVQVCSDGDSLPTTEARIRGRSRNLVQSIISRAKETLYHENILQGGN